MRDIFRGLGEGERWEHQEIEEKKKKHMNGKLRENYKQYIYDERYR